MNTFLPLRTLCAAGATALLVTSLGTGAAFAAADEGDVPQITPADLTVTDAHSRIPEPPAADVLPPLDPTTESPAERSVAAGAEYASTAAGEGPWVEMDGIGPMFFTRYSEGFVLTLEFSCGSDDSTIVSCTEASGARSGDHITLGSGDRNREYHWTVTAVDAEGRTATKTRAIIMMESSDERAITTATAASGTLSGWSPVPVELHITRTLAGANTEGMVYFSTGGLWTHSTTGLYTHHVATEGVHRLFHRTTFDGIRDTYVRIDLTPPTLTVDAPVDFSGGEPVRILRGSAVPVDYACADALSGVRSCGGDIAPGGLLPTSTLGTNSVTIAAVDEAGHRTERTLSYQVISEADLLSVSFETDAERSASGWYTTPVSGAFVGANAGEDAIAEISINRGNGWESLEGPRFEADFETEGRFVVHSRTATNNANSATFFHGFDIDWTGPTIDEAFDASHALLIGADVTVTPECSDEVSGVASCEAITLDTSEAGEFIAQLRAIDNAGNETVRELHYVVIAEWNEPGGDDPITEEPGAGDPTAAPAVRPAAVGQLAQTGGEWQALLVLGGMLALLGLTALGVHRAVRP
ncbi:hypothetical protein [Salinibacterium sp. ZJ70]|uniref:hypothetical protein n=1 Tax=Salinibacterium sp. ZJ70 TaxID=2708084 RepID=UPI0014241C2D|nr:hypothetical protein [Salinibacterium sp. ZJ70]